MSDSTGRQSAWRLVLLDGVGRGARGEDDVMGSIKNNSKAILCACCQFVVLCQQLGLSSEKLVAIDGIKFKAVNNHARNFTAPN